ncbi:hypothetical protein MUO66_07760 [Candidatus Bathyarchaeota archaeon]|nr:hypothetical protein [Candidatus Bathyarchaeota archaeon]
MKPVLFLSFSLFIFCSTSLSGQKKFVSIEERDNVAFSYKWKQIKTPDKTESYKLALKIKNNNSYAVKVTLEVGYYWDAIPKASSESIGYCLKAKKSIRGDIKRGGFESADFTMDELTSDRFELEFNSLEIEKVNNCSKK